MNKLINKYNMSVTNEIYYVAATETYKLLKFSHFIYADLFSGAKKYAPISKQRIFISICRQV